MSILDNMKPKREDRWQNDPPTDKQINAIDNMSEVLGWRCYCPATKEEAANIIEDMKKKIAILYQDRPKRTNYDYLHDWCDDD